MLTSRASRGARRSHAPSAEEGEASPARWSIDLGKGECALIPKSLQLPPQGRLPPPPINTAAQLLPLHELDWNDFERLCLRLAWFEGAPQHVQPFGTPGQAQSGIDIYSRLVAGAGYVTYQCKKYERLRPLDVRNAVSKFLQGDWAGRSVRFVFCTTASLASRSLAEAVEAEVERLRARTPSIEMEVWDRELLSVKLKDHPRLVADFFGTTWAERFIPGAAARARHSNGAPALIAYRWAAELRRPQDEDPHPDFLVERIQMSWGVTRLSSEVRVVCLATWNDVVLYTRFPRELYKLRWQVSKGLDPASPRVFWIREASIDGTPLELIARQKLELPDMDEARGVESWYAVPPEFRGDAENRLKFDFDSRLEGSVAETSVFNKVTDAEFRLTVPPDVPVELVGVGTTGVTPTDPEHVRAPVPVETQADGTAVAVARFPYPLEASSNIIFYLSR